VVLPRDTPGASLSLADDRTGYVRVRLVNGGQYYVKAQSFGEAASKTPVGRGQIQCFTWTSQQEYNTYTREIVT
jgi:hypothetical protein